jgi:hypothetical protein
MRKLIWQRVVFGRVFYGEDGSWKLMDEQSGVCECVVVENGDEGVLPVVWFPLGSMKAEVVIEAAKKVEQIINGGA